jgi:hypothetical protein
MNGSDEGGWVLLFHNRRTQDLAAFQKSDSGTYKNVYLTLDMH